ncbi:O-antigen ligase family protein [Pendulispora albinea]|uniref:O-antigen ligase family protein n=1 Tax=Pendulispora albinea TaxID=2741071 RepID=A0ABZ2M1D3_9BACT
MGLVGAVLLVVTIFLRPQEVFPFLQGLGFLNIVTGLAVLGIIIEFASGRTRSAWTPQLPYLLAFAIWCFLCTLVKTGRGELMHTVNTVAFSTIFMLVIAYATRGYHRFAVMAVTLVGIAVALSSFGIVQSQGEFECIIISGEDLAAGDKSTGTPTGRSCVLSPRECDEDARRDGMDMGEGSEFLCEKPGPFHTFTIGHGRVRWRGVLADPNELALAIGAAFAFCFALYSSLETKMRHAFFLGVLGLAAFCVIQTQSRGGVLVLAAVLGAYFIRRYGYKGAFAGVSMALPLIMFGGRGGEEAESSSLERLGALYEGVDMFRASPIFGVGQGQFVENYFITAHNSYLLAAAELGLPGLFLFSMLLYVSMKIPYVVAFHWVDDLDERLRPFALSLFVAFVGILIGITFLSFCYHAMLFIYLGLAGALYGAVKQTSHEFRIKVSWKEYLAVLTADVAIMSFLFVYTRIKGAP